MPQDQNRNDDEYQLNAQEFSAKAFGDPLLSLSSVWASGWMTQISRLNAVIRKDSDLDKKLKAQSKQHTGSFFGDVFESAGVLALSGGVLVSCYLGATVLLGAAATEAPEIAAFLSSLKGTWGEVAVPCGVALLIGMGMLSVARLGWNLKLELPKISGASKEPETFKDLLKKKIEPNQFHFGNLQVGYQISDGRLIVRSLGDEFYAVFKHEIIRSWDVPSEAGFKRYQGWYGEHMTPPLVLKIRASGLDETSEHSTSELLIHGLQFEAPGEKKSPAAIGPKDFGKLLDAFKVKRAVSRGHC